MNSVIQKRTAGLGLCVPDVIQVSGPDSSYATMHAELTEPPPLRSEDASAVDSARKRLTKSKRLTLSLCPPKLRDRWAGRRSRILREQPILADDVTITEIDLNDSIDNLDVRQDIYKWAVVYENQRGCVL